MSENPYIPPVSTPPVPPPLPAAGLADDTAIRFLIPVGRSVWAIAAGYLGIFSFVVIPAPISLVVSLIAIRDLRRSKFTAKPKLGMGRAVFGLVMGIIGTLILALIALRLSMSAYHSAG